MKKVFCVLAVLSVLLGAAWAEGIDLEWEEFMWTEKPGGAIHAYEDCAGLMDEIEYEITQGTMEQAFANKKYNLCVSCMNRLLILKDATSGGKIEKLRNGVQLPTGTYIAGEDIPAGSYRIHVDRELINLFVHTSTDRRDYKYNLMPGTLYNDQEIGKLTLSPGNVLEITGPIMIYIYEGIL